MIFDLYQCLLELEYDVVTSNVNNRPLFWAQFMLYIFHSLLLIFFFFLKPHIWCCVEYTVEFYFKYSSCVPVWCMYTFTYMTVDKSMSWDDWRSTMSSIACSACLGRISSSVHCTWVERILSHEHTVSVFYKLESAGLLQILKLFVHLDFCLPLISYWFTFLRLSNSLWFY